MFLTFVSPPKDHDVDLRFLNSVYGKTNLDAEANSNVRYIRWHFLAWWLYGFEKPKHTQKRRSAPQHATDHGDRDARGLKAAAARQCPRGLPHLRELLLLCACMPAGENLRPDLETTSGEEIPCPDLSRRGRNTPFRWIFRSWKLSEPTFVSTCSVHRSYCRRILYISRFMDCIGGTVNCGLKPCSWCGYCPNLLEMNYAI